MKHGRYERQGKFAAERKKPARRRKLNKLFLVTLSVFLLVGVLVGGTLAYIFRQTNQVENTFVPATVSCRVNDTFTVTNTGNVDAYIRAAVVVNWMADNGDIYGLAPKETADYTLSIGANWQKIGDYYYYTTDVAPDAATDTAVCSATLKEGVTAPQGFSLCVEVVAEAIQADGTNGSKTPVEDAWGVTYPLTTN